MYSSKWLGFGISQALTKTVLHFFPTSPIASAPYPVQCKIEIFSNQFGRKSLVLDGARLHQPDGIKLDAAFPVLGDGTHPLFGVSLELSAAAQRVEVSASQCFLELITAGSRIRYRLKRADLAPNLSVPQRPLLFKDERCFSSIVLVNGSDDQIEVTGINPLDLPLAGQAAVEVQPDEAFYSNAVSFDTEMSKTYFRSVSVPALTHQERVMYVLQREAESKKIQNVYSVGIV